MSESPRMPKRLCLAHRSSKPRNSKKSINAAFELFFSQRSPSASVTAVLRNSHSPMAKITNARIILRTNSNNLQGPFD